MAVPIGRVSEFLNVYFPLQSVWLRFDGVMALVHSLEDPAATAAVATFTSGMDDVHHLLMYCPAES